MPLLILALLLAFPGLVLAEEPKEAKVLSDYMERRARFELASNCEPMRMMMTVWPPAQKLGLLEEYLLPAVESRLRAARLYTEGKSRYSLAVWVQVSFNYQAFFIKTSYTKGLLDPVTWEMMGASTWEDEDFAHSSPRQSSSQSSFGPKSGNRLTGF